MSYKRKEGAEQKLMGIGDGPIVRMFAILVHLVCVDSEDKHMHGKRAGVCVEVIIHGPKSQTLGFSAPQQHGFRDELLPPASMLPVIC